MNETFNIGDIVVNDLRQFAKIIAIKSGRYGLSGWTSKDHAEEDTVAQIFLNINGMLSANLQVVSNDGSTSSNKTSGKAKVKKPKAKTKVK